MDLLSRGAFSVLSTLFSSLSLVRNKTTGKQKKLHVAWEKRKVLAVVEFPSKNLKPPGKALRRWNIYETFFSPNAHSSGIAFCSLNLFLYLLNETLNAFGFFFGWKPFSLLVWLMSDLSLLPPTGPCVSSVFQCCCRNSVWCCYNVSTFCQSDPHE